MSKIAFFVTTSPLAKQVHNIILETSRLDTEVYMCETPEESIAAAEQLINSGTELIIARGAIAKALKNKFSIPIVEITITAQELSLLISEAKKTMLANIKSPSLCLIAPVGLFCDLTDFNQIFDIQLKTYFYEDGFTDQDMKNVVNNPDIQKADLIIGGQKAQDAAAVLHIPYLPTPNGDASIRQAFTAADTVLAVIEQEKKYVSEISTLLDYSYSGMVKLDVSGHITMMNKRAEEYLGFISQDSIGKNICDLITEWKDSHIYSEVFEEAHEVFCAINNYQNKPLAVSITPLLIDNVTSGAILSCHKMEKLAQVDASVKQEARPHSSYSFTYDELAELMDEHAAMLPMLRHFAQCDKCVLLTGGFPLERRIFAQFIQNISLRSTSSYVYLSAAAFTPDKQIANLFGTREVTGAIISANGGTLYLDEIEHLIPQAQYRLSMLISENILIRDEMDPVPVNVRLILGSQTGLKDRTAIGFDDTLYYSVVPLSIDMPLFIGCPTEIGNWVRYFLDKYSFQHSRHIRVTNGAWDTIMSYPWEGGLAQMQSFSHMAAATSPKRTLDEATVKRFLNISDSVAATATEDDSPEAVRLKSLFNKYNGNRTLIAKEMNISITTLWRKLKKYNIV